MDDDQKWLEAASGIEQDILYLKAAIRASELLNTLEKEIECLKVALAVYQQNAATGVPWPSPDDLFCINAQPCLPQQVSTSMRHSFKLAN